MLPMTVQSTMPGHRQSTLFEGERYWKWLVLVIKQKVKIMNRQKS